jgi:hypothetical protein
MNATTTSTTKERVKKIAVSEANLRKAATRLLSTALVSTEVAYIQNALGASATQDVVDAKVLAVRAMPWSSLVVAD